jgi:hypothetical protein
MSQIPVSRVSLRAASLRELEHHSAFIERHIGPNDTEIAQMLHVVGQESLDALTDAIVPVSIKSTAPLALPEAITEVEALAKIRAIAVKNQVFRSFIGQGYYGYAERHSAQHPRKPRLVHRLHAVPSGDLAGPDGSADQFPDDVHRPHRHGDCQCLTAG